MGGPGTTSRKLLSILILCTLAAGSVFAQRDLAGAEEARLALERLNVLGSVLMIAAHPDDENTALLAYFSRGRKVRTGYLSLTRGEGGQNLIGPEQGDLLGIIRTEELLAARRIDGAEQRFTRAIDFGFTKSAEETFSKWGREDVLADIVWTIRRFQPDVVVLRFSGTPRDGHGQHQASAILGKEAFFAAADKSRFPDQLRWVRPWQAKRLLWNVFSWSREQERAAAKTANRLEIDTGEYDPLLGYSYSEIAGMSRSMHRSQGFGSAERKGSVKSYLTVVAGDPASQDAFDGIDITWSRMPNGNVVGRILSEAAGTFQAEQPEKTVPLLLKARPLIAAMDGPWAQRKLKALDEAVALCAGLWLDASADRFNVVPGAEFQVELEAINRSHYPLTLVGIRLEGFPSIPVMGLAPAELAYNLPLRRSMTVTAPDQQPYSQPYWLREPKKGDLYTVDDQTLAGLPESPPVLSALFQLRVGSQVLEISRPVSYRYVDRVRGELVRPLEIVPAVAVKTPEPVLIFPDGKPRRVEVLLLSNAESVEGQVSVEVPSGWRADPPERHFQIAGEGEETGLSFEVTPPAASERGKLRIAATVGRGRILSGMEVISYPHITTQTVFPPAQADLVRADVRILARNIGYVMGAGDEVPRALHQLGCEVTLLGAADLATGGLGRFDAIVTGVRAFNTRPDLKANFHRLLDYVRNGGTLVVQYNVLPSGREGAALGKIGPYPLRISHDRVTVEEAPVTLLDPQNSLFQTPNKITAEDFNGWIQERGLYFASEWDSHYTPLLVSHDPGEKPLEGGTLYTSYGKGTYIFTAYSWFRELPAGVPGAYRIFANFLSAGKSIPR